MPQPRKAEQPLAAVVAARLPQEVADRWKQSAAEANLNFSDWLRQAVDGNRVRVTGKPTPRRRPKLKAADNVDPELLRQLASIGNNVNQIARVVNGISAAGKPLEGVAFLAALKAIEQQLHRLANPAEAD